MANTITDYNFTQIEARWQAFWDENKTFRAEDHSEKPKKYFLDMFPYPSGAGLHVGHPEGWTANDILSRYYFARGHNVLHPMGWDAFGLPAEQYAVQTGTHPATTTRQNIDNFRRQIKAIGFAIDWDREINTTDPHYYKWTQWIFLQLFKTGLAYVDNKPVWFCPELGTVLANEEVNQTAEGPRSDRGNHPVERRPIRQWVLRITRYADRLLDDLKLVDWPASTKKMQEDWIGRSEGAHVTFDIDGHPQKQIDVYTTRPDTLFGCTYMVLAPEHPLVGKITTADQRATVEAYIQKTASKSDLERTELAKEKSGAFTGAFAVNPLNGNLVPIWVADYVLISYGTGAIMAVPAHDARDHEFAKTFDLPIQPVIEPAHNEGGNGNTPELPFCDKGLMVHSDGYSGLPSDEGKAKITADLEAQGRGKAAVNYKLRDWLFSRQRYWGEPFPIVWVSEADYANIRSVGGELSQGLPDEPVTCEMETPEGVAQTYFAVALPTAQLPLTLPETSEYTPSPTGDSPLSRLTDWLNVFIDTTTGACSAEPSANAIPAIRETNTMPQWAGSCWYYLRYLDPANAEQLVAPEKEKYWGGPDLYIGGAEHSVLHLLYARFWHKVLYDLGHVTHPEPFPRLFHQGIILGEDNQKMSKSRGNVVNPDTVVEEFGADSLRLYEMFMGPLEAMKPWSMKGIEGVHRFLKRVWNLYIDRDGNLSAKVSGTQDTDETEKLLHETIKKVGGDIEGMRFNTAISQMMIFLNHASKAGSISAPTANAFLKLLAPFAPHLAEELWERIGGAPSVVHAPWPEYDEAKLATDEVQIGILINGKPRGEALVAKDADEASVVELARGIERVAAHLDGKTIRKVIYKPGKILNIVAN